jgi:hypothetical protein
LKGFEVAPEELSEGQRERCRKRVGGEGGKVTPMEYEEEKGDEEKATLRDLKVEVGEEGS